MGDYKPSAVASAVPSGFLPATLPDNALRTAHTTARRTDGFTLAELLVTVGVLVVLMLLFTQLLNSAANITTLGHKRMDGDSQARELFDRMAIDVMKMVKRSDVYYHLKASTSATDVPPQSAGRNPAMTRLRFTVTSRVIMRRAPLVRSRARSLLSDTESTRTHHRQRLLIKWSD